MLKNPNPKKDWAIGDTVYFEMYYSQQIVSAHITSLVSINGDAENTHANVKCLSSFGDFGIPLENLFESHELAAAAQKQNADTKIAAYKAEMPDAESMVRFAYNHVVASAEEYTDWEARQAYQERAKEIFGIEL